VLIQIKVELLLDAEADSTEQVLHTLRLHPKRAAKFSMVNGSRAKLVGARVVSTAIEGEEPSPCSGW